MTFKVGDRVNDQWNYLGQGTVTGQPPSPDKVVVKFDRYNLPQTCPIESVKLWTEADDFKVKLHKQVTAIENLLLEKNRKYGDSALNPVRTFSKADSVEQIKVRIDDKLSRIQRGQGDDEDTVTDLIGYLIMLKIAEAS